MATFLDLQNIKISVKTKMKAMLSNAKDAIFDYFEQNESLIKTDFCLDKIEDVCTDCDDAHELTHFPSLRFTCFFEATGEESFFVELTVFKTNIVRLTVNEGNSFALNLTAERTLDVDSEWKIEFWGDDKIEKEMERFVFDITPLVFVYTKSLGLK